MLNSFHRYQIYNVRVVADTNIFKRKFQLQLNIFRNLFSYQLISNLVSTNTNVCSPPWKLSFQTAQEFLLFYVLLLLFYPFSASLLTALVKPLTISHLIADIRYVRTGGFIC